MMKTFKDYITWRKRFYSITNQDYEYYINKRNILHLCSYNTNLRKILVKFYPTIKRTYFLMGMEWDIDVGNYHQPTPAIIHINPEMRWTDRAVGRESLEDIYPYEKWDGDHVEDIHPLWVDMIKDNINNITLSNGNYIILTDQLELQIVEPFYRNTNLFKEYSDNYSTVIYSEKELNNFYHNRPHNLPV